VQMTDIDAPSPGRASRVARTVVLLVIYVAAAGFAVSEFIKYPGVSNIRPGLGGEAFFGDMIYGRAFKPYVTRVLVPWMVRLAVLVTPPAIKAPIERNLRQATRDGRPEWLFQYPFEFWLTRHLLLIFAVGFAFALRRLGRLSLGRSGVETDVIPVATLFCLPGLYGYASHLYDLPALCLFTLGLCLIAARRYVSFVLVFVLCTLNKETALLLTLVWLIFERRSLKPRQLVVGVATQVVLWALIRGGLAWLYRANPGEMMAVHLFRNFQTLAVPIHWFEFRPIGDWLIVPYRYNALYVLGFAWALVALRRAPQFLKDAFWIAVPVTVLTWLYGNVDEMRVYYELLPIVVLVLAGSLYRLLGYTPRQAAASA